MNILILEDEATSMNQLVNLVHRLPYNIYVQATLTTVQAAVDWLVSQPTPDLILAEVLLPDGLSFEIFDRLQLLIPVIYCTNYQEYVLDAFDTYVIDYVLKPITAQKLVISLNKFTRLTKHYNPALTQPKQTDCLKIKRGTHLLSIPIVSIRYIYFQGKTVYVQTLKSTYPINQTLDELEQRLNPTLFYRANRQHIIHRHSIMSVEHLPARKIGIELIPEVKNLVVVSKARAMDFLRWGGYK